MLLLDTIKHTANEMQHFYVVKIWLNKSCIISSTRHNLYHHLVWPQLKTIMCPQNTWRILQNQIHAYELILNACVYMYLSLHIYIYIYIYIYTDVKIITQLFSGNAPHLNGRQLIQTCMQHLKPNGILIAHNHKCWRRQMVNKYNGNHSFSYLVADLYSMVPIIRAG